MYTLICILCPFLPFYFHVNSFMRQATHKRPNKKASPVTIAVPFECVYSTEKCCLGRQLTAFWGCQYSVRSSIFILHLPWSKCVVIGSTCPSNRARLCLFSGSADHSAVTSDTSSCKNNLQPPMDCTDSVLSKKISYYYVLDLDLIWLFDMALTLKHILCLLLLKTLCCIQYHTVKSK